MADLNTYPKRFVTAAVIGFSAWFLSIAGYWPELYVFNSPSSAHVLTRVADAPVYLHDDVMIQMRTGLMLLQTGIPQMNRSDLAQPSSSLLAPYCAAALLAIFPPSVAVAMYAALGTILAHATIASLTWFARSTALGVLTALALILTSTHYSYALNGWDHLFQAFFFSLAVPIALKQKVNASYLTCLAILLVLGTTARLDGIIMAIAILCAGCSKAASLRHAVAFGVLPFALLLTIAFAINFSQFGWLTPTTTRLKLGASPSFYYAVAYAYRNGVLLYSTITLFPLLAYLALKQAVSSRTFDIALIITGAVLTSIVAFINSDVFPGGRMFWAPCVVCASVLVISNRSRKETGGGTATMPIHRAALTFWPLSGNTPAAKVVHWAIACIVGLSFIGAALREVRQKAAISTHEIPSSLTAQTYVLGQWIKQHLVPEDGAIGVFLAGISFELSAFEIADFLGKGDESIARLGVKWGPPGHNKWDIETTIDKWRPQAIIPVSYIDVQDATLVRKSASAVASKQGMGFAPALIESEKVRRDYVWALTPSPVLPVNFQLGILLRRDVANRLAAVAKVVEWAETDGTLSKEAAAELPVQ